MCPEWDNLLSKQWCVYFHITLCSPIVTLTTSSPSLCAKPSSHSLPYSVLYISLSMPFPTLCLATLTHPLRTKDEPLTGILQAFDLKINQTLPCFSLKLFQVYVSCLPFSLGIQFH